MPAKVCFRFYEELNDFLPPERRKTTFCLPLTRRASVKDWIEGLGVPHTEIDLILANGTPTGFDYVVQPGDRISVYPRFESLDICATAGLRPRPLRRMRFVADTHLGRLAMYLRMLGFDTLYQRDLDDAELAHLSHEQNRILLTRDQGLLKRRMVNRGYYVRSARPLTQLVEVMRRFDLAGDGAPFSRCLRCNEPLEAVAKGDIAHLLPPTVRDRHQVFRRCPLCGRLYWKGSHYQRMQTLIDALRRRLTATAGNRLHSDRNVISTCGGGHGDGSGSRCGKLVSAQG